MNDNKTRVWFDDGFYDLTPMALTKGAAILGQTCILFSPVSRFLAPHSYDFAVDVVGWVKMGTCKIANDVERAFCLAIQDEIRCPFEPSRFEVCAVPE